jgi:hypothetical protein
MIGISRLLRKPPLFPVLLKPYGAMIHQPLDGAIEAQSAKLCLIGQGYDLEKRRPLFEELSWSSIDGELGKGARIEVGPLSAGDHVITLITGHGSRVARASIRVSCR